MDTGFFPESQKFQFIFSELKNMYINPISFLSNIYSIGRSIYTVFSLKVSCYQNLFIMTRSPLQASCMRGTVLKDYIQNLFHILRYSWMTLLCFVKRYLQFSHVSSCCHQRQM